MTLMHILRHTDALARAAKRRKAKAVRMATLTVEDRRAGAPPREKVAARAAPEKR